MKDLIEEISGDIYELGHSHARGNKNTIDLGWKYYSDKIKDICLDRQKVLEARKFLRTRLIKSKDGIDCDLAFKEFDKRLGL